MTKNGGHVLPATDKASFGDRKRFVTHGQNDILVFVIACRSMMFQGQIQS
jgi:hypothetical protein